MVTKKGPWPQGQQFICGACRKSITVSARRLKEHPPKEPGVFTMPCPHCGHVNTHRRYAGARR